MTPIQAEVIRIRGLTKRFGSAMAVTDVDPTSGGARSWP